MHYLSIDIETTGLDKDHCDILEFAAIYDNMTSDSPETPPLSMMPVFQCRFRKNFYTGQPVGLAMNSKLLTDIHKGVKGPKYGRNNESIIVDWFEEKYNIGFLFYDWLLKVGYPCEKHLLFAGKNVGSFDIPFLKQHTNLFDICKYSHRMLDPAILYMKPEDESPPHLELCLHRAGINTKVEHNAVSDAYDVIQLLRHNFRSRMRLDV